MRPWHSLARPEQLPPDGDWRVFVACAGRGWGKTRAGAEWIAEQAATHPETEWVIIAPTWRDCRTVCLEGQSGVLQALQPTELERYQPRSLTVLLTNGSSIHGYSADNHQRLAGAHTNLSGAWVDEAANMSHPDRVWKTLMGELWFTNKPRVFVTTTPRPIPLLRQLRDHPDVAWRRGSTWDNVENLSAVALQELRKRYAGTRLGLQELDGELFDDI